MPRDYYEVLEVDKSATEDDLKKAYRRLARKFHPDANPDDPDAESKFKELGEAYAVLSDPSRRSSYDRFGHSGPSMGSAAGFDPFDIFASFFGGDPFGFGGRRAGPQRGRDLAIAVEITLLDVLNGVEKSFPVRSLRSCLACDGAGAEPGTDPITCLKCAGSGQVQVMQRSFFGNVMTASVCPDCRGYGEKITSPCAKCKGEGRLEREEEVTVEIPPGVEDGMQLKVNGQGEAGPRGGGAGDLFVQLRVKPMRGIERQGADVLVTAEVPVSQAILGSNLKVDSFDGAAEVEVQPGTQPGEILKVKGGGLAKLGKPGRGDLLVRVEVRIPTGLSQEEEEVMRRFAGLRGEDVSDGQGFMTKIRSAFKG